MADHIHVFVRLRPALALSALVREIKNNSSKFINDNNLSQSKLASQEGYGAFSYAHSQIGNVCNYILHQETHHQKKTFRMECMEFLKSFNVPYHEKYLPEWYE